MKPLKKEVYVPVTEISSEEDYILTHRGGFVKRMKKETLYTFSEEELRCLLSSAADITVDYIATTFSKEKTLDKYKTEYINNLLKQD